MQAALDLTPRDTAIGERLQAMRDASQHQVVPSRFRYLESMYQRLLVQRPSVRDLLATRLLRELERYTAKVAKERGDAQNLLEEVVYHAPESTEQAQHFFECYDYVSLRRLAKSVQIKSVSPSRRSLTDLTRGIENFSLDESSGDITSALMQQMSAQEQDVLEQYGSKAPTSLQSKREPRFVRQFREASERSYMDDLVTQTVREKPENPGPVNPHMLSIRSLEMMRDLSPEYLAKFISYADSMFWIDAVSSEISKGNNKDKSNEKKKPQ